MPDCSNEKALKSPSSNAATELSFQNRSAEKRRIYWIDQDGDRKFYGVVQPGNVFKQPTFAGHAWVITDDVEKCLYSFVATAEPQTVDVGEAVVVAPPQGGQQPIVQAVPQVMAPPAVQAAPQEVQVAPPPPPPVAAQLPPPAVDPQTLVDPPADVTEIPQVSPVEQFQLTGAYRLVMRLDNTKVLNNEASGTIEVVTAQPEWDSAQWTFEAVPGSPFVRMKNLWKKTYLADVNGKPRAVAAPSNAIESHWTFEPVDGTNFVQFRNRETDRFLMAANSAAVLVDTITPNQENNTHWRAASVGSRAYAAMPRNQAYDSALAGCREIGGFWTGSSCRRPVYITEPLACPRGFRWSDESGECQWVGGGNCPPWQMGPGGACRRDMVCSGGVVELYGNGNQACYCPRGKVAWGDYPNLTCVPSISRVAPYLVPAVIGGVVAGIISGGNGRPQIGTVFGNSKNCPNGQTGTPPNCVQASACPPGFVKGGQNCIRLIPKPVVPVVDGNTGTGGGNTTTDTKTRACNNNEALASGCRCELPMRPTANGLCFATPSAGQACLGGQSMSGGCICLLKKFEIAGRGQVCATDLAQAGAGTQTVCALGQRLGPDGKCESINNITCSGGRIEQGVCGCPGGTTLQGGGANFQCVAGAQVGGGGTKPTPPICQLGQRLDAATNACVSINNITCTGGKIEQGVCGCPQGTTLTGGGTSFNCQPNGDKVIKQGGGTSDPSTTNPTGDGRIGNAVTGTVDPNTGILTTTSVDQQGGTRTRQTCAEGWAGEPPNCRKTGPATGGGNATNPVGGPPVCIDGQNTASGCRCASPLTALPGGKCTQPTKPGAACLEGQNIAQTGCICAAPLKQIENGFCGRLLLNETKSTTKGGTCAEGADIVAAKCDCLMKTVDLGGGKFICSANAAPPKTNATNPTNPIGPPVCTDGQNTASGCRCAAPLTVLPGGKCSQPTKAGAACLEGQNIAQTGCNCAAPLKPIENGFCGRLLLNETSPTNKHGICAEGQDIKATSCSCNMKTVDMGGGKFICSAGTGGPSNIRVAPRLETKPVEVLKCPDGTTGTPPNCKAVEVPKCPAGMTGAPPNCAPPAPAKCPDGMVGTPPNCARPAPAKCPDGMVGTPPNCAKPAPAKCPDGMVGTPPNCARPAPAKCPDGMVGTPPNCAKPAPAKCPDGMIGTPPNCARPAPAKCPDGMTGTPPNCARPAPAKCPDGTIGTPPNCKAPPPPPPKIVQPPPPPPKVVQPPPPPPKPTPPPVPAGCAPPKKLNPAGQCV